MAAVVYLGILFFLAVMAASSRAQPANINTDEIETLLLQTAGIWRARYESVLTDRASFAGCTEIPPDYPVCQLRPTGVFANRAGSYLSDPVRSSCS